MGEENPKDDTADHPDNKKLEHAGWKDIKEMKRGYVVDSRFFAIDSVVTEKSLFVCVYSLDVQIALVFFYLLLLG